MECGYNVLMHKLVILLDSSATPHLHDWWPEFLHLVESIPALQREATVRVSEVLYGHVDYDMAHELYFETLTDLHRGLASPPGREAGRLLQEMTEGRVKIYFAEHSEDSSENLLKYQTREDRRKYETGRG